MSANRAAAATGRLGPAAAAHLGRSKSYQGCLEVTVYFVLFSRLEVGTRVDLIVWMFE